MAHTYVNVLVHLIFSTKERRNTISREWITELWAYVGGIARGNGFEALAVGGIKNHLHALVSLKSTLSIAESVQLMKGGSSRWVHDTKRARLFSWQDGYAAFSVSRSGVDRPALRRAHFCAGK